MSDSLGKYVKGDSAIGDIEPDRLRAILKEYPWFTTARVILSAREGREDPVLALSLGVKPAPRPFLAGMVMIGASGVRSTEGERQPEAPVSGQPTTLDIIDNFLDKGEYKIVPGDDTPDYDMSEVSVGEEDLVTEELAQIYIHQGLYDSAKEIYRRLSLLNPEKSIYFAELIDGLDSGKE